MAASCASRRVQQAPIHSLLPRPGTIPESLQNGSITAMVIFSIGPNGLWTARIIRAHIELWDHQALAIPGHAAT